MEHVRWLAEPTLRQPDGDRRLHRLERRRRRSVQRGAPPDRGLGRQAARRDRPGGVHRLRHGPARMSASPTVHAHDRVADGRVWSASMPGGDVIIVLGPEPALRWRLFTRADRRRGRSATARMCSRSARCSPTFRTPVRCTSSAPPPTSDLIDRFELQRSRYEGPDRHRRCAPRRVPSAELAVGVAVGRGARVRLAGAVAEGIAGADRRARATCSARRRRSARLRSGCAASTSAGSAALVNDDDDLLGYVARLESMNDRRRDSTTTRTTTMRSAASWPTIAGPSTPSRTATS